MSMQGNGESEKAMPTEHVSFSYKFAELSESAQSAAVEAVAGKLGGEWFDESDREDISSTIVYKLAEVFGSPGWDTFGEGDFPGIAGVTLKGWDLGRGEVVGVEGFLDRNNAPRLPWVDGVSGMHLTSQHYGTSMDWEWTEDGHGVTGEDLISDAVQSALHDALAAGRDQMDYLGSEENAREWIDANDPDFNEDGSLF